MAVRNISGVVCPSAVIGRTAEKKAPPCEGGTNQHREISLRDEGSHLILPTYCPHSVPTSQDFTSLWSQSDPNAKANSGLCRPLATSLQALPPVVETGASTIPPRRSY